MKNKALLVFLPIMLSLAACTTVNEKPPRSVAKVVKPKKPLPPQPAAKNTKPIVPKKPTPGSGTATYAIDNGKNNFKVESSMPAMQEESLLPSTGIPSTTGQPVQAIPAFQVEDARIPAGTSPAVVALLTDAERNRASGDLDAAVVSTERALRIDSRNPTLTYKLAQLRIKQNKPQMAEELAGKAALLAGGDLDLKRKSWLLIAEARRMQQNYSGAKEAKAKADSFFGH
jgi:predicted Zn-dependent protease